MPKVQNMWSQIPKKCANVQKNLKALFEEKNETSINFAIANQVLESINPSKIESEREKIYLELLKWAILKMQKPCEEVKVQESFTTPTKTKTNET